MKRSTWWIASSRSLLLFDNTENVDFVFDHESEDIHVFADKEQLSRVFINLIKNAIQSIPDNRKGRVGISAGIIRKHGKGKYYR